MPALARGMDSKQLVQMLEELEEKRPHFMEDFDEFSNPPLDEQFYASSRAQSADIDAESEAETDEEEEESSDEEVVFEVFGSRLGPRRDISPLSAVQNIHCPRPVRNPVAFDLDTRSQRTPCPGRARPGRSQLPKRGFSSNMRAADEDLSHALEHPSISKLRLKSPGNESSSGEETFFGSSSLPTDQSPPRLMTQRDRFPLYTGGNSNVFRGNWVRSDGRKVMVAMKLLRIVRDDPAELDHVLTRLVCAARSWQKLSHPNILPFFDAYDIGASTPALITPFCHLGNVGNYIRSHPFSNRDRLVVFWPQVSAREHIVHEDLKPQNVLIDKREIINREGVTTRSAASLTYIAPELLILVHPLTSNLIYPKPTHKSDVYSFGLLSLEVGTFFPTADHRSNVDADLTSGPPEGRGDKSFHEAKLLEGFRPQRAQYDISEIAPEIAIWESPPLQAQRFCGSRKRLNPKA
ncbi:kinase-like domain-containing protein [Mycena rosella]|uniref:Kinase-like domain-containing protein n=1 Tax=Mycena rosella TaxID=1033263 RepID=A0AAD7BCV2_MYCRO|nr:kinase-like domain-containing protein [Mycena rosella]